MNFSELQDAARGFDEELQSRKRNHPEVPWYPYGSMSNVWHLEHIMSAGELVSSLRHGPILDVGAADGDLAFFVERLFGTKVTAIDNSPTNNNGLRGFRTMKKSLGSAVHLQEVDLDSYFTIGGSYDFAFFLGILYHLKNPFYVLEKLAGCVRSMVLSTRITKLNEPNGLNISRIPVAYLLDTYQCNNDPTNFWIFTEAGLRRLLTRTGWDLVTLKALGAEESDPYKMENDQRAFCFIKSTLV